jgi:hypothetical protein
MVLALYGVASKRKPLVCLCGAFLLAGGVAIGWFVGVVVRGMVFRARRAREVMGLW